MAQICIRTDQEELESFRHFCLVNGLSHGQGLALLMRNYRDATTPGTETLNKTLVDKIDDIEREIIHLRNQVRNAYRDQMYSLWKLREVNLSDIGISNTIAEAALVEEEKAYEDARDQTILELSRKGKKPKGESLGS